MIRSFKHRRTTLLTFGVVLLGVILVSSGCNKTKPEAPPQQAVFNTQEMLKVRKSSGEESDFQILISPGTPEEAAKYAQHIKDDLGIELNANLDAVLKFCGYDPLTAREIETTPSDQLMARFPGDVVASRFFAPKIIDVSNVGFTADKKPLGWRKIVRLRTKAGSAAVGKGITAMFLLFNVFQDRKKVADDPFLPCIGDTTLCSDQNQVMLIVGSPQAGKDTAYWLVFKNAAIGGGQRTDSLLATFDGGDFPVTDPSGGPALLRSPSVRGMSRR